MRRCSTEGRDETGSGSRLRGNVLVVMPGFKSGDEVGGGAWKRNKPSPERDLRAWREKERKGPLFSCRWKRGMGKETFKSPVGRSAGG